MTDPFWGPGETMKRVTTLALIALVFWACSGPGTDVVVADADAGQDAAGAEVFEVIIKTDVVKTDVGETEAGAEVTPDIRVEELPGLECAPGEGCFGDGCTENDDCDSGWCVEHMGQEVCSQTCQQECPEGWACTQVAGTVPDVVFICVSNYPNLCRPCAGPLDCAGATGTEDACVAYGAQGNFCGGACAVEAGEGKECPWGFSCKDVETVDGAQLQQCINDTGECPCTDTSVGLGLWTPCVVDNEYGSCGGQRFCEEEGLTDCDAMVPAAETCNGVDDDCDGDVDEPDLVDGNFVNLCDDGSVCTGDETCDGEDGCQAGAALVCDDNDVCTGEETCDPTLGCQPGLELDCDDGGDCTADTCDSESGCQYEDLTGGECLDGNPCTVADHCDQGACVGDPVECNDENPCTANVCTETGGCEYPPVAGECDDEDPCTVGDHCVEGACQSTPVPCDCQSDGECAGLEDQDLCNGTLVCDQVQFPYKCVVDPETVVVCPEPEGDNAFCLQAQCDPSSGECSLEPNHEGFVCDDGDVCTVVDKCLQGECAAGVEVNCNDGNPCTDDSCTPESGCIHLDNDLACNDGDVCTTGDQCAGGACLGGQQLVCDDNNVCTDESCLPDVGCTHVANQAECDDGNACTEGDYCEDGQCSFGGPKICVDADPCTDNICDPAVGCIVTLNEAPCDDGDICTLADHCHLGGCIGGVELACEDGDSCTDDSCNPLLGCQFAFNAATCDDGDPCTLEDACAFGKCSGQAKQCDDQNPCSDDSCGGDGECQNPPGNNGILCGNGPEWQCLEGQCQCIPQCDGSECGDDLCGGTCGECLGPQDDCIAGLCICLPDCEGKECGDDGCEGSCGDCSPLAPECVNGQCACLPECEGKECGDDGCSGECGECVDCHECDAGACVAVAISDLPFVPYGDVGGFVVQSSTSAAPFNAATPHWWATLGPENPGQGGSTAGATASYIQLTATNMVTTTSTINAV